MLEGAIGALIATLAMFLHLINSRSIIIIIINSLSFKHVILAIHYAMSESVTYRYRSDPKLNTQTRTGIPHKFFAVVWQHFFSWSFPNFL